MDTFLILARVSLAAIFLVAAGAKLADMPGSRDALRDFGVGSRYIAVGAVLLPLAEVVAAVLLLFEQTAQIGASLAALLLLAFVAGIVAALRRGQAPDCHCFGQLHSKPAGTETVIRNIVLAAAAVAVLLGAGGPSIVDWLDESSGELIALGATSLAAVLFAYATVSLWRDNRTLRGHGAVEQLPVAVTVGEVAPPFSVSDGDGDVQSAQLFGERPTLLVFTSSTCGPCHALLPELARWRAMLSGRLDIHVLAAGDEAENQRLSEEHGLPVLLDPHGAVAQRYGVIGTPSGVEIDASGAVASRPAPGAPAIEAQIRTSLKRPRERADLKISHVPAADRPVA